jgi:hypothetical protein
MPSNLLMLKLIITPLIIAAATLVSRRWGERIGGLMIGLPLTSGPVSIFFAAEQGPAYAASAAKGSILGLIPVAVFCAAYVHSARRMSWHLAAGFSIALYFLSVWGVSNLTPGLGWEVFAVPLVLVAGMLLIGKMDGLDRPVQSPWWDLPLRMVIATTLLVLITGSASALGSKWGGLLSPFPIFTIVMVTFAHKQGGARAAWRLIRGVLPGLFSYTAFFVVVNLLVETSAPLFAYSLATITALGISAAALLLVLIGRRRTTRAITSV